MPVNPDLPPLVIFGCGYVGTRLARAALAAGRPVRACSRNINKLEPLRELGAELHAIDAARPKQFGPALHGLISPTIVYSIPPPPNIPAGEAVRRATQASLNAGASGFIYLSTAGLYGNTADPDWVDEDTNVALNDGQMAARLSDESSVQGAAAAGLRTIVLRLPAIYGPGRGVRYRLLKGDYKLIDGGEHFISRIHVDDLVRIIFAADEKAPHGALYLVSDDRPTPQKEHATWLCERLKLPAPPSVPAFGAGYARSPQRGRRIRNEKLKKDLGIQLLYPSYIEGEQQIEAEEKSASVSAAVPVPVDVPVPVPGLDSTPLIVEKPPEWREVWIDPKTDRLLLLRPLTDGAVEIVDPQKLNAEVARHASAEEAAKRLAGEKFVMVGKVTKLQ